MYLHSVATNNSAGYKHCLILHCVWHSVLGIFINISFDVFYYLSHMLALFLGIQELSASLKHKQLGMDKARFQMQVCMFQKALTLTITFLQKPNKHVTQKQWEDVYLKIGNIILKRQFSLGFINILCHNKSLIQIAA